MKVPYAGLRGRLVALFLFALMPAICGGVLSAMEQRTRIRRDGAATALRLARLLAAHFEGTLTSTDQVLRMLADHPDVIAGGRRCEAALDRLRGATGPYSGLALVDRAGLITCSSPRASTPVRLQDAVLERLASGQSFALGEAQVGPLSGKVVVLSAHALPAGNATSGIIVAGLDLSHLSELARRINLPEDATFLIISERGTILARYPNASNWVGGTAAKAPVYAALLSSPDAPGAVESDGLDGMRRLYGYAPLTAGGTRFFVAVGLPVTTTLADRATAQNVAGLAIAMTAILFTSIAAGNRFLTGPIAKMIDTAERIGAGDLKARVTMDSAPGELGALARGIDRMAAELEAHESHVVALSRRLVEVQESERRAIARELHDEIGQALTALTLALHGMRHTEGGRRDRAIADALAITERTLGQVRSLSLDLRPAMLDHLGLPATLRWYANREAERAGFAAALHIPDAAPRLDGRVATTLFRIAQEALTNVVRHAAATRVVVRLEFPDGTVRLTVSDDGKGFDVAAARERARCGGSLGILGIEERATVAGGTVHIRSGPDGTEVTATIGAPPREERREG